MMAIMDLHPRRWTMSKVSHIDASAATPIEIEKMTVTASFGT